MTTGIYNTGYNDYFYNQYKNNNYQTNATQQNNINFTSNKNEEILAKKKRHIEKDDGNIGFFKAAKNFVKGVGKFFTGMFTDEKGNFSLGQTLKTAAIAVGVGAVTVLTAGTAVPAMIAAAGIGISAIGMGKAAINIATADTDAEAEAAWQSLGSNTTAGALALAGAKAVAKSSAGAKAAEFDGVTGYFKAGKQVFKDSGEAIANSYRGVKAAYNAAPKTVEGKWDAVRAEAKAQYNGMADTVKANYNKTVYGTKGKIENESKALDKEIKDIKTKQSKIKDKKSSEYKELEAKKTELQTKQEAINEINNKGSWEEANKTITENKQTLAMKKQALAKAKTKAEKTKIQNEISQLNSKIKYEEQTLARRTGEAQQIRSQINKKNEQIEAIRKQDTPDTAKIAKLEKEIADLKAKQEFELPETKITAEEVKTSNENLTAKQKELAEAKDAYNKLEIESSVSDRAYARLDKANTKVEALQNEVATMKAENAALNQKYTVQEGKGSFHPATEIGREAYANPTARWFTVGIAGRQFGIANPYADFYSQLNAQEKEYFKSLPEEQKQALIAQYENLV